MKIKNILLVIITSIFLFTFSACGSLNEQTDDYSITEEMARDIVLERSDLNERDIFDLNITKDKKQDVNFYVVSFHDNQVMYEYTVRCEDGFLMGSYKDLLSNTNSEHTIHYDQSGIMSINDAKQIVLNEVGLEFSQAIFTDESMELKLGTYLYSLEFMFDTTMYDFDIDAKTGEILDFNIASIYL